MAHRDEEIQRARARTPEKKAAYNRQRIRTRQQELNDRAQKEIAA